MRVVTICGSMRFADEMKKIAFILEKSHNMNVLQCVYNEENIELSDDDIKNLFVIVPDNSLDVSEYDLALGRIIHNINENDKLTSLRDWLLPMLMNGQAIITD